MEKEIFALIDAEKQRQMRGIELIDRFMQEHELC